MPTDGYLSKPYELDKLLEVLKDAYHSRLKKKFAADQEKLMEIEAINAQLSPEKLLQDVRKQMTQKKPSLLDIFRELREIDDNRK